MLNKILILVVMLWANVALGETFNVQYYGPQGAYESENAKIYSFLPYGGGDRRSNYWGPINEHEEATVTYKFDMPIVAETASLTVLMGTYLDPQAYSRLYVSTNGLDWQYLTNVSHDSYSPLNISQYVTGSNEIYFRAYLYMEHWRMPTSPNEQSSWAFFAQSIVQFPSASFGLCVTGQPVAVPEPSGKVLGCAAILCIACLYIVRRKQWIIEL